MTKVLCLPALYSAKKYTGISQASTFMDLARTVNQVTEDVEWYFAVPEDAKHIEWNDEMFADIDRAHTLPILPSGSERDKKEKDGFSGKSQPFFSPKCYKFFISDQYRDMDVVMSTYYNANMIPSFQAEYEKGHWHLAPKPAVPSVVNLITIIPDQPGLDHLMTKAGHRALAASMLGADMTIFLDGESMGKLQAIARRHLSATEFKRIVSKMKVLLTPVAASRIPIYKRPIDRAVFFQAGTIVPARHMEQIADSVGKALASGADTSLLICSQHSHAPDWVTKPFINTRLEVSREDLHRYLGEGDFSPIVVDYTSTAIAYHEGTLSGQVPIWWKRRWNDGLYPPDYRLAAKSMSELETMIVFCAKNPKKAKALGQSGIDWIRKLLDGQRSGQAWFDVIKQADAIRDMETHRRCGRHFLYLLLEDAITSLPEEFSSKQASAWVYSNSKNLRSAKDMHSFAPYMRAMIKSAARMQGKKMIWEGI